MQIILNSNSIISRSHIIKKRLSVSHSSEKPKTHRKTETSKIYSLCDETYELQEKSCDQSQTNYEKSCKEKLDGLDFPWIIFSYNLKKNCEDQLELCDQESDLSEQCKLAAASNIHDKATNALNEKADELNRLNKNRSIPQPVHNLEPIEPISLENLTKIRTDTLYYTNKFHQYVANFTLLLELLHTLVAFSSILVFINTYKYYTSYTSDIKFDNFFISKQFRQIDTRRFSCNKRFILPLRNFETIDLSYPFDLYVSAYQKPNIKINLILHVCLLIIMIILLFVDFLLSDFLELFIYNSIKDYDYRGDSEVVYNVIGTGYVANLLRNFTNEFNEQKRTLVHESTTKCEFIVGQLKLGDYIFMGISGMMLVASMGLELYLKRFNKVICEFYFPKWEKQRIVWLYNHRLKKRLQFLETAKKRIIHKQRNTELESSESSGYLGLCYEYLINYLNQNAFNDSELFRHIKEFAINLNNSIMNPKYCILCGHKQKTSSDSCPACELVYCVECWVDVGYKCVRCDETQFDYDDFED